MNIEPSQIGLLPQFKIEKIQEVIDFLIDNEQYGDEMIVIPPFCWKEHIDILTYVVEMNKHRKEELSGPTIKWYTLTHDQYWSLVDRGALAEDRLERITKEIK